jgi:hypothetical protein
LLGLPLFLLRCCFPHPLLFWRLTGFFCRQLFHSPTDSN